MSRTILITLILCGSTLFSKEPVHKFVGKHFLASYLGCDQKTINDTDGMLKAMDDAIRASGVMVLDKTSYRFPPNGLSIVYLLSESHASLHTYPEYGACFVDLFACGDTCVPEKFDEVLRNHLQPKEVNARIFLRHERLEEVPYAKPSRKLIKGKRS